MANYKYKEQLDSLMAAGYMMPSVFHPMDKHAFRFVFSDRPEKNHLPVCVSNPKRVLPGPMKTSGFALSCFGEEAKAKTRYKALQSSFKHIALAIGNALADGVLTDEDGMITAEEASSHFDLYEYENCNLNETFTLKDVIV